MDQAQLQQLTNQKKQNPRLIRKPLNLGSKFLHYEEQSSQKQIPQILKEYNAILLLFGTGWCNITKPFIKELKNHYEQINLQKKNIEIIFVSFDKIREDYDAIVKNMPWLVIPFEDQRIKDLKEFYNVRAIPELVLLSSQGEIVSKQCRNDVYQLEEDEAFQKWSNQKSQFEEIV